MVESRKCSNSCGVRGREIDSIFDPRSKGNLRGRNFFTSKYLDYFAWNQERGVSCTGKTRSPGFLCLGLVTMDF